jgi:hypothetical protein
LLWVLSFGEAKAKYLAKGETFSPNAQVNLNLLL